MKKDNKQQEITKFKKKKEKLEILRKNSQLLKCKKHYLFRQGRLDMKRSPPQ